MLAVVGSLHALPLPAPQVLPLLHSLQYYTYNTTILNYYTILPNYCTPTLYYPRYSRFSAVEAEPRDISTLTGAKRVASAAISWRTKAGALGDDAGHNGEE